MATPPNAGKAGPPDHFQKAPEQSEAVFYDRNCSASATNYANDTNDHEQNSSNSCNSWQQSRQAEQLPMIKVMSFNIRYGLADDGENHWNKRKAFALARIHDFGPDLLGLQECRDDAQAAFVRASLPNYDFYGVRRDGEDNTALEMAPILFRQPAFQLIQAGHFWLSDTPQVAGSKSWGSAFARTTTWVDLSHRPTGRRLTFVNTHFDYQPDAIEGAARLMQSWLGQVQKESAVILTGDFNAGKDSAAYHRLVDKTTLFDAYRQVQLGFSQETTFHGFGKPEERAAIDWILVSGHFKVIDAAVDRASVGNLFPSDHYPVLAVLDWKGRAPAGACRSPAWPAVRSASGFVGGS
ncbi:MAG: endonuclease/exonuclease/phosphatase family protein [Caldilineales bacterium]|nr:endonuclease/exonuclease/phosphatase family protein [Caldilineales bacterium]